MSRLLANQEFRPVRWAMRSRAPLQPVQKRFRSEPTKDIAPSYFCARISLSVSKCLQGGGLGLRRGTTQARFTSGTIRRRSWPTFVVRTSTCAPDWASARIAGIEWTVSPKKPRSTTRTFFHEGRGIGGVSGRDEKWPTQKRRLGRIEKMEQDPRDAKKPASLRV